MTEWSRDAAQEILARVQKLKRFGAANGFRLPPRSDERDVVERNLEIISEASRRIPEHLKALNADVDWRVLADLGNVLRHAYHRVDEVRLIEIVMDHLDPLQRAVEAILAKLEVE